MDSKDWGCTPAPGSFAPPCGLPLNSVLRGSRLTFMNPIPFAVGTGHTSEINEVPMPGH